MIQCQDGSAPTLDSFRVFTICASDIFSIISSERLYYLPIFGFLISHDAGFALNPIRILPFSQRALNINYYKFQMGTRLGNFWIIYKQHLSHKPCHRMMSARREEEFPALLKATVVDSGLPPSCFLPFYFRRLSLLASYTARNFPSRIRMITKRFFPSLLTITI